MDEREKLEQAIAVQESLRGVVDDAVIEATLAALYRELAALEEKTAVSSERRKQITVLFADVSGFTAMSEKMDAEDVRETMNALWRQLDTIITAHGGRIDKHIGDAVMALWGTETAREDDPAQAVYAALAMQDEVARFRISRVRYRPDPAAGSGDRPGTTFSGGSPAWRLALEDDFRLAMRIGVNTGPVLLGQVGTTREFTAMGDTVNTANHLEQAAPVGSILISYDTYQHVRGLFVCREHAPIQAKSKVERVACYVVERARPRTFHPQSRGIEGIETRLIGREDELARLLAGAEAMLTDGRLQMLTIAGDAGVGKTRLISEFEKRLAVDRPQVQLFKGRASPETRLLPFGLLRDLFVLHFDIRDTDPVDVAREKFASGVAARLSPAAAHFTGQLLGLDFRESPHLAPVVDSRGRIDARQLRDRALLYLHDYFTAVAHDAPVVMLLEDIHWADNSSLESLNQLAGRLAGKPLFIVCLTRPTLFEQRPSWNRSQPFHSRLNLAPLSPDDSHQLVAEILQKVQKVPDELRELVVHKAEGNPFYLEELIRMLIEDGVIVKGQPYWWVEPGRLDPSRIPTTLTGVLQASLDRLTPEERTVLQQASVVGRIFWDAVVTRINRSVNEAIGDDEVQRTLANLRHKEMIFRRESSTFARTQELIFKHAILREVTYESVLKRVRRAYHALVADWLIEHSGGRSGEYTGLIAEHLEKAGETARAIAYLQRAGEQAAAQYANAEAVMYFSRALELLPPDEVNGRYGLLLAREEINDLRGEREAQAADLAALAEIADALDETRQGKIALRRANYAGLMNDYAATVEAAQLAIALAQVAQDVETQAIGYLRWGWALRRQQHNEEAQLQMTQALELAETAGLTQVVADSLRSLGVAFAKERDWEQAQSYYEQALTMYRQIGDRRGEGRALSGLGTLAHGRREQEQAADYYRQNLVICREIGDRAGEAWALWWLGGVATQQADYAAARDYYEQSLRLRQEIGDHYDAALTLTHLGRTAQSQGDLAAARDYCHEALALSERLEDRVGQGWALYWLGGICHADADYDAARAHYEAAVALRAGLDNRDGLGLTLSRLGQVCLEMGAPAAARQHFEAALALSRAAGSGWSQGYALTYMGNVLTDLGELDTARQHFQEAVAVRQAGGFTAGLSEPTAGLARLALQAGALDEVQGYLEALLPAVFPQPSRAIVDLFRVYAICLELLAAVEDGRLTAVARLAHDLLLEQAAQITTPEQRQRFLTLPAAHRIIAAYN